MGIATSNPDGTAVTGGVTIVPSGTLHGVLADSDDNSYGLFGIGDSCLLSTGTPSVPAGAVLLGAGINVRALGVGELETLIAANRVSDGTALTDTRRQSFSRTVWGEWTAAFISGDDVDLTTIAVGLTQPTGYYVTVAKTYAFALYIAKPVTDVTAPTGTLTEQNRPPVRWTNTLDSTGGPQTDVELKVFTDAQYGAGGFSADTSTPYLQPELAGTESEWTPLDILPNDTYRAYVRVKQSGSNWSDWDYAQFTVNVSAPAVPTLTTSSENGRVALDWHTNSGAVTTTYVEAQVLIDGEWAQMRTVAGDGIVQTTDPATIYDYEAPYGTTYHRMRAAHLFASGAVSYSDWATSSVSHTDSSWWVKHPSDPTLNAEVELRSFAGHQRAGRLEVAQPLGADDAVVVGDTRGPQTGSIVFRAGSDATRDAIAALADDPVPLFLQAAAGHHEPDRWVVLGDENVTRRIDHAFSDERDVEYQWTAVARPSGATVLLQWDTIAGS